MNTVDSVLFYAMVIPTGILLIVGLFKLARIKKHDYVLYRFCQIRRDLIHVLRDEEPELSTIAYERTEKILTVINGVIHDYDFCKANLFNVRKLTRYFGLAARDTQQLQKTGFAQIDAIIESMERSIVDAFFLFTPFLRSEIIFKLFSFIASHVISLVVRDIKDSLPSIAFLRKEGERLQIV